MECRLLKDLRRRLYRDERPREEIRNHGETKGSSNCVRVSVLGSPIESSFLTVLRSLVIANLNDTRPGSITRTRSRDISARLSIRIVCRMQSVSLGSHRYRSGLQFMAAIYGESATAPVCGGRSCIQVQRSARRGPLLSPSLSLSLSTRKRRYVITIEFSLGGLARGQRGEGRGWGWGREERAEETFRLGKLARFEQLRACRAATSMLGDCGDARAEMQFAVSLLRCSIHRVR